MRRFVILVLLVGALDGSSGAATGTPAAQALAHLQAFDESLANLQVDLTAPVVTSTHTEITARLNGLGSLIKETRASIQQGFPGASRPLMLQKTTKIDAALGSASTSQGAAQLRQLAAAKTAETPLEAEVESAATLPTGSDPLALVRGSTEFGAQATGTTTTRTLIFASTGQSPVTMTGARIVVISTGSSCDGSFPTVVQGCIPSFLPGPFHILKEDGCAIVVPPLGACKVTIAFQPTATGPATWTLELDDARSNPLQSYPLTGAGVATGSAQVMVKTGASPTPLTPGSPVLFPERTTLSSFATAGERVQAIQLINNGTASATLDDVTITGPDAHDFILTSARGPHGCEDATLAPMGQCYVSVEVRAARYTRQLKASLVLTGSHTGGLAPIPLALTQADLTLGSLRATSAKGQVAYRFAVTSVGPDPAERVEVDAKITASAGSLRLVSSIPEGCTYGSGTGVLACTLGTLPAHSRTILTVVFQIPKVGGITNEAVVQSLDFDPTPGDDVKTLVTAPK